jgi:acetyl esterase/lipase
MGKKRIAKMWVLSMLTLILPGFAFAQATTTAIIVSKDIIYRQVLGYQQQVQLLKLDIYQLPKGNKTKRPVMILVHGGGFASGDKGYTKWQGNFYPDMAMSFAKQSYVVFSINYRLWPKCPIDSFSIELDNAISDVLTAVKWIKGKYTEYGIDTTKIIICGDSAGGGLVVNASYCNADAQLFAGCIDLWGGLPPYGIQNVKSQPANTCPVVLRTPPTCIIHGTEDDVVPYYISQELSGSLTASGVYNELHPLPGVGHYPIQLSDQIIPIMIDFANKVMSAKISPKP